MRLTASFQKRDYLYAVLAVGLIVAQVWLDITMPDYTAKLTETVSVGTVTMGDVWQNGGMMTLCALGSLACSVACGFFVSRIASSFAKNTRERLFRKITSFSATEMNAFSTPSLITRTTNDVDQLHRFIAMGLQMLIKAPILAVWAILKISNTAVEWTIATAVCVAVVVVTVGSIIAICVPKFNKVQGLTDKLNDATRENLSGVRVVRAYNAEAYQEEKFEKANAELTKNQLFTARATGLLQPMLSLCMNGLTLAIYWIGAILIERTAITEKAAVIGNMTAFMQYAMQVVMAFMMLIMMFIILPRVIVSARRISEVLKTEPTIVDGKTEGSERQGEIEFDNVCFRFSDGGNNVLDKISFCINKGETVAIVGATGSGKTTILDLMTRLYDVTDGSIRVDGVDVRDYTIDALQSKIAVATQKAVLFKGTIADNVTYGGIRDEERLKKALDTAQADFVFSTDMGTEALVAQGGSNYSGGQKQRLSIARAVYKEAEIVAFDDSFSALDYRTDAIVRQKLKQNLAGKTIIIVAQRIGTIKYADKIIVMDKGRVAGVGTHKELLDACPVYKEIALSQLSKEEL